VIGPWLDVLSYDLRYARRTLMRTPGFTATALISLAIGIGANASIFSLVDQVLLRRLPVKEPERLVHMDWAGNSLSTLQRGAGNLMSYPLCLDLQKQEFFDGVFCRHPTSVNFSTGQQNDSIPVELVSGSYFPVLGVNPELGRLIGPSDDLQPAAHPVVVLSYNYWKNNFAGAQDAVGRKVLINGYPMTVIGIAPAGFVGVDPFAAPSLWIPAMMARQVTMEFSRILDRRAAWMHVFGRLKPGMTAEAAQAGVLPWFKSMIEADTQREGFPNASEEQRRNFLASTINILPADRGLSSLRGVIERPLLLLMGGTVLLLLLASLNVAGLLLARGAARSRELTTRLALGASRSRITGQLLIETMLITFAGGLLGLALAPAVSQVVLSVLAQGDDLIFRIDLRVFLFTFVASVVSGLLCGLAPILQSGRIPLIAMLKERSRIATVGGVRLRKMLVVGQMALTLLLLIGAGLFVQTLSRLHSKVGFSSNNLLMFSLNPQAIGYAEPDAEQRMRDVWQRLRDLPGVESVAVANTFMLSGGWQATMMTIQSEERIVSDRPVPYLRVSPGFFPVLGTQVIAGRDFDERDVRTPGSPPTAWRSVIVNESFVRRYFKGRSPVGYRMGVGTQPNTATTMEIIGVVRDFSRRNLRDEDIEHVFVPYWDRMSAGGSFYLKMRGKPESAFASIRAVVEQVDRNLPVRSLTTYEDQIGRSVWIERALAALSSAFGTLALVLSMVGLFGVMSFVVTNRTQEIGIRMALGASRSAAVWLIVREVLIMIGVGTVIALPGAWALRRLVEAQLYGVHTFDGLTIAFASCLLAAVALGAAMLPAWRAASVSPTEALRLE